MRSAAKLLKRCMVDFFWDVRGPRVVLPPIPHELKSVLFVCKGNICRSPFAEHLASSLWPEKMFASAGLHVSLPVPAPKHAIHAAKKYGLDLEMHRSQPVSQSLMSRYDMIMAMEVWQYLELRSLFAHHSDKIFLLAPFASVRPRGFEAYNIADPYGGEPGDFDKCFERISECVGKLVSDTPTANFRHTALK